MRSHAKDLLEGFAARGECEFMGEFADHYPIAVICGVLGVPAEDHRRLSEYALAVGDVFSLEALQHEAGAANGYLRLAEYFEAMIQARGSERGDDLLSDLLAVEEEGDRLRREELVTLVVTLLFAGHDTTRNQLGLAMYLFARHPEQWRAIRKDPDLIPRAIDEVLRFRGTTTIVPRIPVGDVEVGDTTIPSDTLVLLSMGSGNHDPSAFQNPEEFDIWAERTERHLTFGGVGTTVSVRTSRRSNSRKQSQCSLPPWRSFRSPRSRTGDRRTACSARARSISGSRPESPVATITEVARPPRPRSSNERPSRSNGGP